MKLCLNRLLGILKSNYCCCFPFDEISCLGANQLEGNFSRRYFSYSWRVIRGPTICSWFLPDSGGAADFRNLHDCRSKYCYSWVYWPNYWINFRNFEKSMFICCVFSWFLSGSTFLNRHYCFLRLENCFGHLSYHFDLLLFDLGP